MERFFGFDLGDAESAVCVLSGKGEKSPRILPVCGEKSLVTAYASLADKKILIGENACYHPQAVERKLRFKSRFLKDEASERDVRCFALGVLNELYQNGDLTRDEDCAFYIGCPAGWGRIDRERYRKLFEESGFPPVKIISESRAAMVSACQSRHLQVGYDILSHPVLVVDIGSSTTDFAYIMGGKEVELRTAGEVYLGGGLMDELLLEKCVAASPDAEQIREVFQKSGAWKSYCEFAARRLKEKYFSDEEFWKTHDCEQTIRILYDKPLRLTLKINEKIAEQILYGPMDALNGSSFYKVFRDSLLQIRDVLAEGQPDLLFLTGGVSRLGVLARWCGVVYPDAVVITGTEPEFSVTRGLAWCGRVDEDMKSFAREVEDLKDSSTVERIVAKHIGDLYRDAVDQLTQPIIENAVIPVLDQWRNGEINTLSEIDAVLTKEVADYLQTKEVRKLLQAPVASWLKPVAYELEEYTVPICVRHNVPYRALSLNSYLSLSEVDIKVEAKDVFAVEELTFMIDTIITILVGLLCGGGGIAIVAQGLPGIIAGAVISILVLIVGKDKMQQVLLNANIPVYVRKLIPRSSFTSRMDKVAEQVKEKFYESLHKENNAAITERMAEEISAQIDDCLVRMAKVVEIPLVG